MKYTDKTSISQQDYIVLQGLKYLANKHRSQLDSIIEAASEIVGETDRFGHSADVMYDENDTIDSMLERLGIKVDVKFDERNSVPSRLNLNQPV